MPTLESLSYAGTVDYEGDYILINQAGVSKKIYFRDLIKSANINTDGVDLTLGDTTTGGNLTVFQTVDGGRQFVIKNADGDELVYFTNNSFGTAAIEPLLKLTDPITLNNIILGADSNPSMKITDGTAQANIGLDGTGNLEITLDANVSASVAIDSSNVTVFDKNGIAPYNTNAAMTSGSVLFADAAGRVQQDNAKLFWDNTNDFLGVGTNTPARKIDITGGYLGLTYSAPYIDMVSTTNSSPTDAMLRIGKGDGLLTFAKCSATYTDYVEIIYVRTNGTLDLVSTTGALTTNRLTTAQRNALTPVNGMIIYNTTDNKFQGYENGGWANLI